MRNILMSPLAMIVIAAMVLISGCAGGDATQPGTKVVPREDYWGIYELDLVTQDVRLVYSSPIGIFTSVLRLDNTGDTVVFVKMPDGVEDVDYEIYTINTQGKSS